MRTILRIGTLISKIQKTPEKQKSNLNICVLNNIIESDKLTEDDILALSYFLSNVEKTFQKLERK